MNLKEKELQGILRVSNTLHPQSNVVLPLNPFSPYDGIILTNGEEIGCEYKFRQKYSSFYLRVSLNNLLLLEQKKYNSLLELKNRFDKLYYITETNDNKIFVFDLEKTNFIKDRIDCPKSTLWDRTYIKKDVYYIDTKDCILIL